MLYVYGAALTCALAVAPPAAAQTPPTDPQSPPAQEPHDHAHMAGMDPAGWHFMQDGVVYGLFNHQGGAKGDQEGKAPNWWMGQWSRSYGRQNVMLAGMLSLDPATVGHEGYAELFQSGETLDGTPLVNRQHPHDFFMQLSAAWRFPVGAATMTIAGAPAGEPALGPVAFMHRASSQENPVAPLGHHTLDSTHITYGVVTAGLSRGRWTAEGSVFNGREPDENRWDFDFGPLDSYSGRLWFKPNDRWEFQASTGRLKDPEELEPGNVVRTTLSASWLNVRPDGFAAVTTGFGMNRRDGEGHESVFAEGNWRKSRNAMYGRLEIQDPEVKLLLEEGDPVDPDADPHGWLLAVTAGVVRDLFLVRGFSFALGADITGYVVPDVLRAAYGQPISVHAYVRLRLPQIGGPMWNMRMGGEMQH